MLLRAQVVRQYGYAYVCKIGSKYIMWFKSYEHFIITVIIIIFFWEGGGGWGEVDFMIKFNI